jgi:serine/threonine protein kinase
MNKNTGIKLKRTRKKKTHINSTDRTKNNEKLNTSYSCKLGIEGKNQIFDENVELEKEIGKGGSGDIYLGKLIKNKMRKIAAKHLKRSSKLFQKMTPESYKEVVLNEVMIQSNTSFRHITKSLGYFTIDEESYILIQEYASNGNLKEFINKLYLNSKIGCSNIKREKNTVSESLLAYIAYSIIIALNHLFYLDVLHQDIKPENILVDHNLEMKLTDFTVSVKLDIYKGYYCFLGNGTHGYMSPENLDHEKVNYKDSIKNDYYSLGVLIYKLFYGYFPYDIQQSDSKKEQFQKIKNKSLKFSDDEVTISDDLKNFLIGLLNIDFRKRFGIKEIFSHPWIAKAKKIYLSKQDYSCRDKFIQDLYKDNASC